MLFSWLFYPKRLTTSLLRSVSQTPTMKPQQKPLRTWPTPSHTPGLWERTPPAMKWSWWRFSRWVTTDRVRHRETSEVFLKLKRVNLVLVIYCHFWTLKNDCVFFQRIHYRSNGVFSMKTHTFIYQMKCKMNIKYSQDIDEVRNNDFYCKYSCCSKNLSLKRKPIV